MTMTSTQRELYQRIQDFSFNGGPAEYPFHRRLAEEQGWSHGYTARVITEYRRFAFLAVVAGHPVSPSDPVDQVWHLHLLYTESYWQRFCGNTLAKSLHHQPSAGGRDEREKFEQWYAKTLTSYGQHFDARPPADIWPDVRLRFSEDLQFRRVARKRCWIIKKPWKRGV